VDEVAVQDAEAQATGSDGEERYAHLAQRAAAFVRDQGGAVHEDALIAHVFGSLGTPALWRPLLRPLLGTDGQLTLRADGSWALPDIAAPLDAPLLAEFVAVDVETTGLRPLHQRIIEVALIRFRDGEPVARFETFCNPERRVPSYISKLTGITDTHVAEAPSFGTIADEIEVFLGTSLVIGHNVRFDVAFLNAELKRIGRPALLNESLDTLGLATRLLTKLRKPSLDKVAQEVGLSPRRQHRAGYDAELTGEIAIRLGELARQQGIGTLEQLKATGAASTRRPREKVGRGHAVLDRSLLADIPRLPGVYLMYDQFDHVVYVGKAKNLRDRVGSYYSQPLGYTRKMDGLLESMARIEVEVVGSELEALLLEAQLIRRYQPRYNTALRAFEHYPFIRVDIANPWPRVTLAKARKDDGARYFGPFRHKTAARKTVDVINQVVPLRTCPRSFKDARSYGSPCLQLDLGRCLGPCVGRADRDKYAGMVHDVVAFLDGRDEVLNERLLRGLELAAAKLDFEAAARLRNDIQSVNAIVGAQRQLRQAAETHTLLLILPSTDASAREVLLVVAGRIWAQLHAKVDDPADLMARLSRSWDRLPLSGPPPVDHDSVDEANILNRWLYRNAGHPAILPLPHLPEIPDWPALAMVALALTDEELTRDVLAFEESANLETDAEPLVDG
jgi:DNA polymerase III epsilon subunit family exonuclease